jgi:hypothetical protein
VSLCYSNAIYFLSQQFDKKNRIFNFILVLFGFLNSGARYSGAAMYFKIMPKNNDFLQIL